MNARHPTIQDAFLFTLALAACGDGDARESGPMFGSDDSGGHDSGTGSPADSGGHDSMTPGTATTSMTSSASGTSTASSVGTMGDPGEDSADDGVRFDLGGSPSSGSGGDVACQEQGAGEGGGGDTPGCEEKAPPGSFEADVQWKWTAEEKHSVVTPLVANFTDDNGDGRIEPCADIPDVVVTTHTLAVSGRYDGFIYVLDGATGALHFKIANAIQGTSTPALGDIDHDGLVEIVAGVLKDGSAYTGAFEHDGTLKWLSPTPWPPEVEQHYSFGLADLDNDGNVEILVNNEVYDHEGNVLWAAPLGSTATGHGSATAAADLDDDGDLEIVLGNAAYHHDGTPYYATALRAGFPQIANLDGDPEPEILLTNSDGLSMLEHDGQIKYSDLRPTGDQGSSTTWNKPATVHDFDGNGIAEFAMGSALHYTVYNGDASIVWMATVSDKSGSAAGTAFDFLGDGTAEAMYADEVSIFVFNEVGAPYFAVMRQSATAIEYPIVADLDNDGSAEIAVTSEDIFGFGHPTVQVIRDKLDRWIQARRIWNQHAYHVTNVNEDGTIPQFERPSWKALNTYRTNAQINAGGVCRPVPEG